MRATARKNAESDKSGSGKVDWGLPGDELFEVSIDPRDPVFDEYPEDELDEALFDHLNSSKDKDQEYFWEMGLCAVQPQGGMVHSPISPEHFLFCYEEPVATGCAEVDVDDVPDAIPLFFGLSESPKGSWLHGFGEPTPLKLPKNAVWPDVPRHAVSTHCFFE